MPEPEGAIMHDHRRSNITIENKPAFAAVFAFVKRLDDDQRAVWACPGSTTRIHKHDLNTGACSFVDQHVYQHAPRGIVDGLGKHAASQGCYIESLQSDPAELRDQHIGKKMWEVAPFGCDLRVGFSMQRTSLRRVLLPFCTARSLAAGGKAEQRGCDARHPKQGSVHRPLVGADFLWTDSILCRLSDSNRKSDTIL
jgi:hypothetical protein